MILLGFALAPPLLSLSAATHDAREGSMMTDGSIWNSADRSEEGAHMRIETMTAGIAVQVSPSEETIELRIGEPQEGSSSVASLSVPQAEMVLHALGFGIAQIREQQRRSAAEREHLAQVVEETEVRRR